MLARRWVGTRVFAGTEARVQLHDPLAVATSAIVEGILIVFVWVLAQDLLPYALFGSLVYSVFLIGQLVLSEAAYIRIEHHINELYHASPLSPEAYFLGLSSGILLAFLPTTFGLFVLLEIVHPLTLPAFGALLLILLTVWTFSSSLAYVISTLFKDMKAIWPYASLITNLLGVVPPVFYPLAKWPAEWRPLAMLIPTSGGAAIAQAAAGLQPLPMDLVLLGGASLAVEATVMFLVAVWWSHRSAREA
ncbi:MAG: ABC transporter permease [Methanobacteriota archaeon]